MIFRVKLYKYIFYYYDAIRSVSGIMMCYNTSVNMKTHPDRHVFCVRDDGQDERDGEHVKHACLGVFYVFKGMCRVREVANM